jgi:hypothetical protein
MQGCGSGRRAEGYFTWCNCYPRLHRAADLYCGPVEGTHTAALQPDARLVLLPRQERLSVALRVRGAGVAVPQCGANGQAHLQLTGGNLPGVAFHELKALLGACYVPWNNRPPSRVARIPQLTNPKLFHIPYLHTVGFFMRKGLHEAFDKYRPDLVVRPEAPWVEGRARWLSLCAAMGNGSRASRVSMRRVCLGCVSQALSVSHFALVSYCNPTCHVCSPQVSVHPLMQHIPIKVRMPCRLLPGSRLAHKASLPPFRTPP